MQVPIDDDSYRGEMNETRGPRKAFSWNGFITFWILLILFGCAVAYAIYTYFPRYMVLCLTKEFMISGILGLVCLILFSVVLKLWNRDNIVCVPPSPITQNTDQSTSKLGENSREHYARTNRRTVYAVSEAFRNANANKSTQQMKPRFEGNRRQPKRCFQCNSTDHLSYQCPINKRSGGKQNSFNIRKNVDQQLNNSGPRQ